MIIFYYINVLLYFWSNNKHSFQRHLRSFVLDIKCIINCILILVLLTFNRCFECKEELSTHCNKKALAQTLDFLQKHSAKAASGSYSTEKHAEV